MCETLNLLIFVVIVTYFSEIGLNLMETSIFLTPFMRDLREVRS